MARPRDPGVDARVLATVRRCLAEDGPDGLTIDEIARRAGVGKAAIYRRWKGRAQLVFEATVTAAVDQELPDTGSVVTDLTIMLERLRESLLSASRSVMGERIGTMIADAAFAAQVWETQGGPVARTVHSLWERAVGRGEVRADAPGWRIVNDLSYVVLWRILVYHDDVTPEELEELVRRNVGGALVG